MIELDYKTHYSCHIQTICVEDDHDYFYNGTLEELLHEEETKYFTFSNNAGAYMNLFLKDEFGKIYQLKELHHNKDNAKLFNRHKYMFRCMNLDNVYTEPVDNRGLDMIDLYNTDNLYYKGTFKEFIRNTLFGLHNYKTDKKKKNLFLLKDGSDEFYKVDKLYFTNKRECVSWRAMTTLNTCIDFVYIENEIYGEYSTSILDCYLRDPILVFNGPYSDFRKLSCNKDRKGYTNQYRDENFNWVADVQWRLLICKDDGKNYKTNTNVVKIKDLDFNNDEVFKSILNSIELGIIQKYKINKKE